MVVDQGAHAAPFGAGDEDVAHVQAAALDQHGRYAAAATLHFGFDDDALGGAVRVGLQLEHFGLQQDSFFEFFEILARLGRDFHGHHVAAHVFDDDLMLEQFLAHARGVSIGLVDLVDGDDDRHASGLSVVNRLDGLRHDAVVGGDHEHDDVGGLGAARAHGSEGFVAGRVEEGDRRA